MLARVLKTESVAPGIRALALLAPEAAESAVPGQFVMVEGGPGRTTRRPFSVSGAAPGEGVVRLTVREVGPASAWLANLSPGDELAFHGPLGTGFALPPVEQGEAWLVAGGMGAAPLLFLAAELRRRGRTVWAALGSRSDAELWAASECSALGAEVAVATEDGSAGLRGLVTDLLAARLREAGPPPSAVYACGPRGMLVAVARRALEAGLRCQVSVEERMACGVGACAGCTWPDGRVAPGLALRRIGASPTPPGEGEGPLPLRVCRDGPCFEVTGE